MKARVLPLIGYLLFLGAVTFAVVLFLDRYGVFRG